MVFPFFFDDFSSNCYVVGEYGKPCILIDNGCDSKIIINFIKGNFEYCAGVLLTHGHFDHIQGLNDFLNEFNCTLFVDKNDEKLLSEPSLNCSRLFLKKDIKINYDNIYLLDDDDEINFFNKYYVKVIETPFHTNGSICLLINNENALFTGDTLFKNSIGRTDLVEGNNILIESSLKKLLRLNDKLVVYPGHGEITSLKNEIENNDYLRRLIK